MSYCAAPNCKSDKKNARSKGISFHEFPSNFELREKWILAVMSKITFPGNFWKPSERAAICSLHFTPDCYRTMSKRKMLIPGAVPTIFSDNSVCATDSEAEISSDEMITPNSELTINMEMVDSTDSESIQR